MTESPYRQINVTPLSGALGAEVAGVDLSRPIDDAVFAEIESAFHEHLVLFFRDQRLERSHLKAFTGRFGPLLRQPYIEPMADDEHVVAVLKQPDETGISTFGGTWHSDLSFLDEPPLGSVLYAVDVPDCGGDTLWANQYLAYESLSGGMRALLADMRAVQVGTPYGQAYAPPPDMALSRSIGMRRGDPEADRERCHPVVRTHPATGRKALNVNQVYCVRFEDMTRAESRPLLKFLRDHATRPELCCRFRWRNGSLAIWDNRCTQHLAVNDYDGRRRLLYRTAIAGDRPV